MRLIALTLGMLGLLAPVAPPKAPQRLADFRRVVVADQPRPVQQAAAEELAHYVSRITGRTLAIVPAARYDAGAAGRSFFIGEEVAAKLLGRKPAPWKNEEWLLETVPQGLILAGDDQSGDPWSRATRAGSMLAVYTLLDDYLGVRWFWPGAFGEHVPHDPAAVVPELHQREAPRFLIRSIYSIGYGRYHTAAFKTAAERWARRTRQSWTMPAWFGHSWTYAFELKTDAVFQAHPDWFALVDGKRRPPQMCTSNPEVIDRMVAFVLADKAAITSISPSDGGGFCQCTEETKSEAHKRRGAPSCTALDVPGVLAYDNKTVRISDRIFTYANEIARRVRAQNPRKGVGIIAYTFYNKPPLRIKTLEPNLYLSFVYQAAAMRDPQAYQEWKESVAGWQKLGAKMVVREGWGMHYYLDLPYLQYDQIRTNLAEAAKLGFMAAYGEGGKNFATQAPNYWAVTRMMWDPERDSTPLMDDYFRTAYGPAAPEMRAFFETYNRALERNWAKRRRLAATSGIAYANLINSWSLLFPEEVIAAAERHLAAAEKLAPPGEYAERVAFHRFGQTYTRTMLTLLDTYRRLTDLGVSLDSFRATGNPRTDEAERAQLLRRAFELGEARERLLLEHRDWAAIDEGLYAFANDNNLRQWHATVKKELGTDRPSAVTGQALGLR